MKFNGVIYTYVHNLQGDIVGLLDSTGALAVEYRYDAWGKPISITGNLADTLGKRNPFRYRGYVYDEETGLYYVESRYYNSLVGRFVNADEPEMIDGDDTDIGEHNLFAYCLNSPIVMSDENGFWASWATKLVAAVAVVAVVVVAAAVTVATAGAGTAPAVIAVSAAKGAAIGFATGAASGAAQGAYEHRRKTGSWDGVGNAALSGMANGALAGAVTGTITGAAKGAHSVLKAAKAWNGVSSKYKNITPYQDMARHYQKHVIEEGQQKVAKNIVNYTRDALKVYAKSAGNRIQMRPGVIKIKGAPGGIYTQAGKILSFWYITR